MLALSTLMATKKRTPGAARRCRKRMDRALLRVQAGSIPDLHGGPMAVEAIMGVTALADRACRMCGLCKGR